MCRMSFFKKHSHIKTKKKSIGFSISIRIFIMDKSEIIELSGNLKTASDLASLLDSIKQNEFGSIKYGISEKMLKLFRLIPLPPNVSGHSKFVKRVEDFVK